MSLQHNTYIIDVLKDTRERERKRKFTVDEIQKREEDERKKERGGVKMINRVDVKKVEKKQRRV